MTDDPYELYPQPENKNAMMLNALMDNKFRNDIESKEMIELMKTGINLVAKIPHVDPEVICGLNRDWEDIKALSECEGTDKIVLEKETQLLFEIAAIGAYGGEPLKGISSLNQDFKEIDELKKE